MKNNKFKILALTLTAILAQGTYTFAATSKEEYSADELNNREPGYDYESIHKSNYKVENETNNYSSAITTMQKGAESSSSSKTNAKTTTKTTSDSNTPVPPTNVIPIGGGYGNFWAKNASGKWTLYENGMPASGWKQVSGSWYYLDAEGSMQTGWLNIGYDWYYLNSGGDMAYNTYVDGYYLDSNGVMQ